MFEEDGFFSGLSAKDILGYGLESYKTKESITKNQADKAASDAQTKAYEQQQQKATMPTGFTIDKKTGIYLGLGVGAILLGILAMKAK
ncbi:hypothetical protein WCX49_06685 [Sulfurimonas sp. HSL-1656]|uniref:hypothetical protein n=1 Tax=Thiomicrolovo subterrani TaxID=3131934 RepID=UPI0031F7E62D